MAERQTWHTYIPYTDRIDYFGGVHEQPRLCLAVEKLGGHRGAGPGQGHPRHDGRAVPHPEPPGLVRDLRRRTWARCRRCSTCSPTASASSISSRRSAAAACTRRGSASAAVAQDLPRGWDRLITDFLKYLPPRLADYDKLVMKNSIFKGRTKGVGAYTLDEAIEWGVTGPGLRACGMDWDFRKKRPYSGYENFDFDIPDRDERGLLRPRGGARRGDPPEPSHRRAVRQEHARGAVQVRAILLRRRRSRNAR